MKKIFTSISLAALSCFAAIPVSAQQQPTAAQAGAFVEAVVPAMLEQVKTVSGLDVKALMAGDMDAALLTTTSMPTVSIQPDSVHLNVANIVTVAGKGDKLQNMQGMLGAMGINLQALPVYFSNYTSVQTSTPVSMNISLPQTISATSGLGGISLNLTVEPTDAMIPFKLLKIDMEVTGVLASIGQLGKIPGVSGIELPDLSWLKNGNILTLDQASSNGISTLKMTLGEVGMGLSAMMFGEDAKYLKSFSEITDPTKATTEGYIKKTTKIGLTTGTELLDSEEYIYNPTQLMPLVADSVVTLDYDDYGQAIDNYTKYTYSVNSSRGTDGYYLTKVVSEYQKNTFEEEWGLISKDSTIMASVAPLDDKGITLSAIKAVMMGIASATEEETGLFEMWKSTWENGEYTDEMGIDVEVAKLTSVAGKDSLYSCIDYLKPIDDEDMYSTLAFVTGIVGDQGKTQIIIPNQGNVETGMPLATFFFKTNLLQNVTENEAIAPQSDVTINVAENGIYVNNCEKGRYSIVSINGKMVANGIISGQGAFVATPGLQRGQVYIFAVEENGVVKAIKFVK
ncbi:MAG: hypothetical protein ACI30I_03980 [Parabacteroides sp.]